MGQCGRLPLGIHIAELLPPDGVLPALPRVGLAPNAVHRNGNRLVRLPRDGAQRHAPRAEPLDDSSGGLHLLKRDGLSVALDLQKIAQHLAKGMGGWLRKEASENNQKTTTTSVEWVAR